MISSLPGKGSWPLAHGFIQLEAGTAVSAVKMPEGGQGKKWIRLYETEGQDTTVQLAFAGISKRQCWWISTRIPLQIPLPEVQGSKVVFPVGASVASIKLVFA